MKLLIFILLIPFITQEKIYGANPKQMCGNYVCAPGYDSVTEGFDIVRGEPTNQNIVKLTFGNKIYVDHQRNVTYGIPDEINMRFDGSDIQKTYMFNSTKRYQEHLTEKAKAEVKFPGFSANAEVESVRKFTDNGDYYLAKSSIDVQTYRISLNKDPMFLKLDTNIQEFINHLPENYEKGIYRRFLKYAGTHFIYSTSVGGKAETTTLIKASYVAKYSEDKAHFEAKAEFLKITASASYDRNHMTNKQEWVSETILSTSSRGGLPGLNMSQWSQWSESVIKAPVRINYELKPICSLISNQNKAINCDKAVNEYLKDNEKITNYISNCKHLKQGYTKPSNSIATYHSYYHIVPGKSPDLKCLISYIAFESYQNNVHVYGKSIGKTNNTQATLELLGGNSHYDMHIETSIDDLECTGYTECTKTLPVDKNKLVDFTQITGVYTLHGFAYVTQNYIIVN